MVRIDVVGLPGAGKTTFLKNLVIENVKTENYLREKAVVTTLKAKLLHQILPPKQNRSYLKSLFTDFVNGYDIDQQIEKNRLQFYQNIQKDQLHVRKDYVLFYKRLAWLMKRFTEVEILEDYSNKQPDQDFVIFDESLLHKLILFYVNLGLEKEFSTCLASISPPKGLIIFKHDLSIASERIIRRREKQKIGRPADGNELEKLRGENLKYQNLLNACVEFFKNKVPIIEIDLKEPENISTALLNTYFNSFNKAAPIQTRKSVIA